ncbi:MAG: hypothetical protein V1831_02100 [Candidatus Woesearchaeota archaeon]
MNLKHIAIPFVSPDKSKECETHGMKFQAQKDTNIAYCVLEDHTCPYQSSLKEVHIQQQHELNDRVIRYDRFYSCTYGTTLDKKVEDQS